MAPPRTYPRTSARGGRTTGRPSNRSAGARGGTGGVAWAGFVVSIGVLLIAAAMHWAPELVVLVFPDATDSVIQTATTVSTKAIKVFVIGVVLAVTTGLLAAIQSARARQRDRVAAAVAGVTRSHEPADRAVRITRTLWGKPRQVRLLLPADFASEDHGERGNIEVAVTRVLGGQWQGDWDERSLRKGKVRLRRTTQDVTDSEQKTLSDEERLAAVARRILGAQAKLTSIRANDDGQTIHFAMTYPPSPRPSDEDFRKRAETALTDLLGGLWEVEWDLRRDRLIADHRPPLERLLPYEPLPITDDNLFKLAIARAAGLIEPAAWNLESKTPHALVTGETGGGKTVGLTNLMVEALRRGIPVYGLDPKMVELMALEGWPGFESLATSPQEMADTIGYLHDLMMHRYTLIRRRQLKRSDLWPAVAILDEMLIMQEVLNDHWAQVKAERGIKGGSQHPAIRQVIRMAALARTARVHLVVGVQRPQATLFPEGARDNFRFRLSLGSLSQEGAIQMWGDANVGRKLPADIPGRGTISTVKGPREAQVFRLPELDLTVPDEELPEQDAALRRQLLEECKDGLANRRPGNPVLDPFATTPVALTKELPVTPEEAAEDEKAAVEPVRMAAKDIGEGDLIFAPDPQVDDSDSWVEATVESVELVDEDEDLYMIEFRLPDGTAGAWELTGDDKVEFLGGALSTAA